MVTLLLFEFGRHHTLYRHSQKNYIYRNVKSQRYMYWILNLFRYLENLPRKGVSVICMGVISQPRKQPLR